MELVEGRTLARWSAEAPRRWPEVLAMMIAAGRGLASAHAAGLIHRDFKPENVMVAHDGRVLVMDFGLARSREDADAPPGGAAPSGGLLDSELTRAGALVGTPAYMAPEQLAGGDVGPLTDSPTV
jgi:serine/threonine protein kinase